MPPAISVENLSKQYVIQHESQHDTLRDSMHHVARRVWRKLRWGTGFTKEEFWALRDVSFEVQPGEVLGIIGRNGAGKSTLLKILSRITEPTTGRVTLRGRVASLLEVGTGFHPELSGRENIYLNGAILGMSRVEIRKKFDEIVAFAEVEKFLDTPVKRYSSGMYVRLAFAVAAHLEPEILIVDEVLAVGDLVFQQKCLGKMREVANGDGRTVLFVSHNMAAIRQLCDRVLMLAAGRIECDGRSAEVLTTYESGGLQTSESIIAQPYQVLPGFTLHRIETTCVPPQDCSPWTDLHIYAAGLMDGRWPRYGFGLQLTSLDGTVICRLGSRILRSTIPTRPGPWAIRFELPAVNRLLVGGRYLLQLTVQEDQGKSRELLPAAIPIDLTETDPYQSGVSFNAANHGLMALPVHFSEVPAPTDLVITS